jgi:hypothetical protein
MAVATDRSLVSDPPAQAAIATLWDARAAGRNLRHCAELMRQRYRLEMSRMTIKRVLETERAATGSTPGGRLDRHCTDEAFVWCQRRKA